MDGFQVVATLQENPAWRDVPIVVVTVPKLLYIEDNDDNLYTLSLRFDVIGGYEMVTAVNGAEVIAKASIGLSPVGYQRDDPCDELRSCGGTRSLVAKNSARRASLVKVSIPYRSHCHGPANKCLIESVAEG
jgi:hypothetical protein